MGKKCVIAAGPSAREHGMRAMVRTVKAALVKELCGQRYSHKDQHEDALDEEGDTVGYLEEKEHGETKLLDVHAHDCKTVSKSDERA